MKKVFKYSKLAFVDIETTGTDFLHDRIIEISILKVENNKLVEEFASLINPETIISPFITQITGIRQKDLEKAPTFFDIYQDIKDILKDCIFVAHNVRFDYGFIKTEFKRLDKNFRSKTLDTVKLSRYFYPQFISHNLDSLISRFGFECLHRHRAYDDAKVLLDFYLYLHSNFSIKELNKAFDYVQKKSSLPIGLEADQYEMLPETPGVYIFYGNNELPLYIGKSVNIRNRVLSHFQASSSSQKELQLSQQIKNIQTINTASDFSATILESQLIKDLKPIHNRQLRSQKEVYLLRQTTTPDNYYSVFMEKTNSIPISEINNIIGIFSSKRKVENYLKEIAQEFNLCLKLLGLDHSPHDCFNHQLGICQGACIKEEPFLKYNLRFLGAFSHLKLKPWPFDGPIMITESNPYNHIQQNFIVDNWCLLASIKSDSISNADDIRLYESNFDYDLYKIFKKFFNKLQNRSKIKKINKDFIDGLYQST